MKTSTIALVISIVEIFNCKLIFIISSILKNTYFKNLFYFHLFKKSTNCMINTAKILFIFLSMQSIVFAQADTVLAAKTEKTYVINEKSIVKDSVGNTVSFIDWMNGVRKGTHMLMPNFNKEGEFIFRSTSSTDFKFTKVNAVDSLKSKKAVVPSAYFTTNTPFNYFKAKTIKGEKINEKALLNKILVVNFWFTNCGPCKLEIPDLNAIAAKYSSNKDIVFLAVALDDEVALKSFFDIIPFTYNQIANGRYIADMYGVKTYPTHVIVDKKGVIKFHTTGLTASTTYWIDKTIQQLLAE